MASGIAEIYPVLPRPLYARRMFRIALYLAGVFVVAGFLAPGLTARFIDGPKRAGYAAPSVNTARPATRPDNYGGHVRIPADRAGHYVAEAQINGRNVNVMVDTGASLVILRYEDARALGLVYGSDKFDVAVQTANGTAKALRVKLYNVRLGSISLDDIEALVMEEGLLNNNLLGMSFLRRLSRYEVRGDTLVLER
jgi:aspartyl protease family protein